MRALIALSSIALFACTTTGVGPSSPATASTSPPSPTPSAAASNKAFDPKRVNGRLPPEIIQKVVRSNFAPMRKCYEEGLVRNPKLEGKIATRFVIETDGKVSSAVEVHDAPPSEMEKLIMPADNGPRFPDKVVEGCVVSKFAALTFPKPEGGIVTVVYPIVFAPGD